NAMKLRYSTAPQCSGIATLATRATLEQPGFPGCLMQSFPVPGPANVSNGVKKTPSESRNVEMLLRICVRLLEAVPKVLRRWYNGTPHASMGPRGKNWNYCR